MYGSAKKLFKKSGDSNKKIVVSSLLNPHSIPTLPTNTTFPIASLSSEAEHKIFVAYGVILGCGTRGMVLWLLPFHCHYNPQLAGRIGKMGCKILILLKIITILLRHFPFNKTRGLYSVRCGCGLC